MVAGSSQEASSLRGALSEFKALDGDDPKKLPDLLSFLNMKLKGTPVDLSASDEFREVLPQMAAACSSRRRVSEAVNEYSTSVETVDGEEVDVIVKYGYDVVKDGGAGDPGIAPWIDDIVNAETGESIPDSMLSAGTLETLVADIAKIVWSR